MLTLKLRGKAHGGGNDGNEIDLKAWIPRLHDRASSCEICISPKLNGDLELPLKMDHPRGIDRHRGLRKYVDRYYWYTATQQDVSPRTSSFDGMAVESFVERETKPAP